jgi:hypothetical protein
MARRKKHVEAPTEMEREFRFLHRTGDAGRYRKNEPKRIERGTVVQLRDNQGRLYNTRAIVMGKAPSTNYTRAYGAEYYVCEVSSPPGMALVVSDAVKTKDKAEIKRAVDKSALILEKNATLLKPVGRVKKIPQVCALAMKIEKGKL